MMNNEFKSLEPSLKSIIDKLGIDHRNVNEFRNPFLLLFTLRYLSSSVISHELVFTKELSFDYLLGQREKGFSEKLMNTIHLLVKENPRVFNDGNGLIELSSAVWGKSNQWNSVLYNATRALGSLPLEEYYQREPKIFANCFQLLIDYFTEYGGRYASDLYSPESVGFLLVALLEPSSEGSVYDPVCGSGGFLAAAANYIREREGDECEIELTGQELDFSTWLVAKLRMIVNGYESAQIFLGDTLHDPKNLCQNGEFEQFDTILANPPFSLKSWNKSKIEDKRFEYGTPPNGIADYAFILHVLYSLKNNGGAAIIVPTGVLFRGGVEGGIREKIIEENFVDAVISLPPNMFNGTVIAANILILKKNKENKEIIFIDASKEFTTYQAKNILSSEAINQIVSCYKHRVSVDSFSYCANIDEVRSNGFLLQVSNYLREKVDADDESLTSIFERQCKLEGKLNILQKEMSVLAGELL